MQWIKFIIKAKLLIDVLQVDYKVGDDIKIS